MCTVVYIHDPQAVLSIFICATPKQYRSLHFFIGSVASSGRQDTLLCSIFLHLCLEMWCKSNDILQTLPQSRRMPGSAGLWFSSWFFFFFFLSNILSNVFSVHIDLALSWVVLILIHRPAPSLFVRKQVAYQHLSNHSLSFEQRPVIVERGAFDRQERTGRDVYGASMVSCQTGCCCCFVTLQYSESLWFFSSGEALKRL